MKQLLLLIGICIFITNSYAISFTDKDTVTVKTGDVFLKKEKIKSRVGPLMVTNLNSFIDSINSTIPDSMPFYDWITDDIHQKKFNFGNIQDTVIIVLNDSNDHYTPPFKGNITSSFGKRRWRYHYGMDIDLNTGDTVRSAFNGRVRISTYSKTYGNVVVVRHNNGLETLYAHLSKRLVNIDSVITSGTVVGLGGNTGRSFGSHLHFEVRYFDEALDPRDIISFESYKTHYDTLA
ncbi:MAG: M23 family metallopeptidase, partial [Flavobacteriales bacterium]|nr:M23 family metallopeptidase [Flavobacteriales bacterium]